MEWLYWTLGYAFVGYLTFLIFRNNYINIKYQKLMGNSENNLFNKEWALHRAKLLMEMDLPFLAMAGVFWVVCLPCLIIFKARQNMPTIPLLLSKSEKEVNALKANKALTDKRKAEWDNALRTMEAAGIDTKGMRHIEIE